ncbi:MAG: acyltransferase [Tepidisphaeraceae bacterium]|jgi:peptidoglycan/LPS O-acetylase OafA/YrhL
MAMSSIAAASRPSPGAGIGALVAEAKRGDEHRIQLDAIRAMAVILVMVQHFDPGTIHWIELGFAGVRVFFVLSGFLITGILLRARQMAEIDRVSKWRVLRNFYARRFLRIFPVYYLVILLTWLAGIGPMRESVGWHLSYLSNIYFFKRGTGNFSVTHLWSLAVEEQFYLLWPLLILFLPRKSLVGAIVSAICIGPLFRAGIVLRGGNAWQASVLMPACLDALGMGALVAVLTFIGRDKFKRRLLNASLLLGVALYIGVAVAVHFSHAAAWTVPYGVSVALWSAWLIDGAYSGFGGTMGKVLSFKPAVYLGTISYGVYLIHNFVPDVVNGLFGFTPAHELPMPIRPIIMFLVTVFLASVSWYGFERPINALKRFFPYRPSAAAAATAAAE